jgi:hypothetical protein
LNARLGASPAQLTLIVLAVLAALSGTATSCAEECPSAQSLMLASNISTFSFIATSSPDNVVLPVFVPCTRLGAGSEVSVHVRATDRRADEGLLLAVLDSELLGSVSASDDVATLPLLDDRNVVVCDNAASLASTTCGLATPGPERKVAAVQFSSESNVLSIASDGPTVPPTFVTNVAFAEACIAAAQRECAAPTVTIEACAAAASVRAGCALDRTLDVENAFRCEADCGEACDDPCGVRAGVR